VLDALVVVATAVDDSPVLVLSEVLGKGGIAEEKSPVKGVSVLAMSGSTSQMLLLGALYAEPVVLTVVAGDGSGALTGRVVDGPLPLLALAVTLASPALTMEMDASALSPLVMMRGGGGALALTDGDAMAEK